MFRNLAEDKQMTTKLLRIFSRFKFDFANLGDQDFEHLGVLPDN